MLFCCLKDFQSFCSPCRCISHRHSSDGINELLIIADLPIAWDRQRIVTALPRERSVQLASIFSVIRYFHDPSARQTKYASIIDGHLFADEAYTAITLCSLV